MKYTIFDIEADGLLETISKIHCLSYQIYDTEQKKVIQSGSITDYNEMSYFIQNQEVLVGHNIIMYDIPAIKKILRISDEQITSNLIDTLGLSWYLYPLRPKHGLEVWGDEFNIPKPFIADWNNQSINDYIHRCEMDVRINLQLFKNQMDYLSILYEGNEDSIKGIIDYLSFKLDCAREQEEVQCRLDVDLIDKSLEELQELQFEKETALIEAMPRDIKYKEVSKPAKMYKKDGSISSRGADWLGLLSNFNLPEDYEGTVRVEVSNEPGNPGSHQQIKDWLFSLGWEPRTFEFRKNNAGEINKIPQVYVDDEVCESIRDLYNIEPALENLDMLSLIKHRIGIFDSYKENMDLQGFTKARIHGFTNTLRFRHKKPIVNLPKAFKFYGENIRGSIIAPNDSQLLCGSDMSSLEDTTKQHYMYFFDPEYVTQMRVPGFDPHLDIAVLAKMLTEEQAEAHKRKEEDHSQTRGIAKVVNFAGIYGAGPPKIAQSSGMSLEQAKNLHTTYWKRNKSVKLVEKSCKVKKIEDQMWLRNPVSGFWYSLRYLKDKFSTLNQGTGVFCFDLWVREVRSRGIKIMLQYHDEIVFSFDKGQEENISKILKESIEEVNRKVKLNVPLNISVEFGENYAKIH